MILNFRYIAWKYHRNAIRCNTKCNTKPAVKRYNIPALQLCSSIKAMLFLFATSGEQCCKMLQRKLKNTAILLAFVSLKLPKKTLFLHVWSVPNDLVTFRKNVVLRYHSNVVLIGVQHAEYSNKIAISKASGKLFFQLFEFVFQLFELFFSVYSFVFF